MEKSSQEIKEEIIMLSDLKYIDENLEKKDILDNLMDLEEDKNSWNREENDISYNKIKRDNELKKISSELYYKIDNKKKKELESAFNQKKLKIKFDNMPRFLRKGKIYTKSKTSFTIYDNNYFKKIIKIKLKKEINPICAIQLENNDLVLASISTNCGDEYELLIYRLKDNQYNLFQKMKEGGIGHLGRYVN